MTTGSESALSKRGSDQDESVSRGQGKQTHECCLERAEVERRGQASLEAMKMREEKEEGWWSKGWSDMKAMGTNAGDGTSNAG